ncbi:extracellular solute-binding protein [Klugiella xanthotipulae]|uniref:Carbohydrate ABC transporter substrate-binding protein (CUT1 family) n=1 Tax=Klugiella xanthotipulae TaxID=244735 RepID=A0A543I676_9MICO|nr:extracellular solute-binding protein [Klugiella xanthotipulae]TQM66102.1 carbohydrate ABC transporter substrate-binding protein (CUT1 family) [Klugiella xanthotipulae]
MLVKPQRFIALGAIATSAALLLSACSGGGTDDKKDDSASSLTVWVDAERIDALKAAAADYTTESGVKVNLVSKDVSTTKDDFLQQAPTGKGPDIIMGAHDWAGELVTNGVISPIELGDKAADFSDVALRAATYEGKVYQLPYAVENIAILRNTALAAETTPATWDDMIAAGKAAGTKYPFVVEQKADGDPYHLAPFAASFGASIFGVDADGGYDPNNLILGDAEGVAFAQWLSKVGAEGIISPEIDGDIAKQAFLDGESPYWLTGPWNVSAATDAGITVAVDPIPSAGGQPANPFAGVKGFYINSESKNAVAANDFLVNYLGTNEVQKELAAVGSVLPALTEAATEAGADPIIAGFTAAGKNAIPMPAVPAMGAVWQYWGIAETEILNGSEPVARWAKLASDVQAAIDADKK